MLMGAAMQWLGLDRPQWLGVLARHNERAIRLYRRFGLEIEPAISDRAWRAALGDALGPTRDA